MREIITIEFSLAGESFIMDFLPLGYFIYYSVTKTIK